MVYGQLPKYLINRLQRVQNTTVGYVYGRYAKALDVINLNWLPIEKNIEMNTNKLAHKSLNNDFWPNYLKLALIERKRNLRSSGLGPIIKQGDNYTFQQQAKVYNNVAKILNRLMILKLFQRKIKGFYKGKALARVLSLILIFMSNYIIDVYCYNLLFFPFQFRFCSLP